MATSGTGAIATFGDMASITGVTISGTYDANQCIKYSDIGVTYSYPYTFIITVSRSSGSNSPNIYIAGPYCGHIATSYNSAPLGGNYLIGHFGTGKTVTFNLYSDMIGTPFILSISGYSVPSIIPTGTGAYTINVTPN